MRSAWRSPTASRSLSSAARRLGGSAAEALVTLYGRRSGAAIDTVARTTGRSHSGAVRLADRLEAAGMVARRRGADQRSTMLHLTPAGRRTARRVLAERARNLQSLLALLTDDQQAVLISSAEVMLGRLGAEPTPSDGSAGYAIATPAAARTATVRSAR